MTYIRVQSILTSEQDSELWDEYGDCMIHLHGMGKSRRGPSFKVHSKKIQQSDCTRLFSQSSLRKSSDGGNRNSLASDSGYSSTSSVNDFDIYLPAPEDASRSDAFAWHLATRNLFAWMLDAPLVGSSLGKSLVDLLERMLTLRPATADNVRDCLDYAESMGYMDFAHSPDYALAMLRFAEHFQLRDLWVDAFVHCVGMNDSLCISKEFDPVSRRTKALITRASLEMDLHLGRVTRALSNFLEDELSAACLGLSGAERSHLDRFRSFLFSFYVGKHGYWPPPGEPSFSKDVLQSMHQEFQCLYDYLVDTQSADSFSNPSGSANGGICVLQNVNAFNDRHNYAHLPHPLPLLPDTDSLDNKVQSQRSLRQFALGNRSAKSVRLLNARTALMTATNEVPNHVLNSSLVQAYIDFEQESIGRHEERLSLADARKVRWITIYCAFQMLLSVTASPTEVRDSFSSTYHMCCLVSNAPPWSDELKSPLATHPALRSHSMPPPDSTDAGVTTPEGVSPAPSIHPDCESDDYFTNISFHRRGSSGDSFDPAAIRQTSPPVSRTTSIRKNVMSTLSRHTSVRRAFTYPTMPTYSESLTDDELPPYTSPLDAESGLTTSRTHQSTPPTTSIDRNSSRTPTLSALAIDGLSHDHAAPSAMDNDFLFSSDISLHSFSFDNISTTSLSDQYQAADIPLPLSPAAQTKTHPPVTPTKHTPSPLQRLTDTITRSMSISSSSGGSTYSPVSDVSSIDGSAFSATAPASPCTPTSAVSGYAAFSSRDELRKQGWRITGSGGVDDGWETN